MNDAELARQLAATAGQLLVDLRLAELFRGEPLGALGDRLANAFLMAALRQHRPEDAILCEEETDSSARLGASRIWIVDPLDGTREYGEGRADWAVHVGLAIDGEAAIGAVALPGLPLTLSSADVRAPPRRSAARLRLLVSRTRPAPEAAAVAAALDAELVPMGSAGAKAMAVVRGEADVYLHSGGQFEWDNCAPVAVARAAGLHVSRLDGRPLRYNQADTRLPDLLVCRAELGARVIELAAGL
ncbi:MAG TPA: 3'(2'),5'-bisphosphate nucleotidase CysQ [Steroidobacteraceae bacterium]|nr:3'(2'),5'-bisphosphate nucleotidase CysQ [Steroidobacteraceae bacterium]